MDNQERHIYTSSILGRQTEMHKHPELKEKKKERFCVSTFKGGWLEDV